MEKNISKAKVLVCDDSMMVRNKMKKLLTAYGFTQIFEASDGAQAVEKFADIVPDVTFMDIVMPELSGVEALKLIKTNSPDAVVIMATSVGTVGNLSETKNSFTSSLTTISKRRLKRCSHSFSAAIC